LGIVRYQLAAAKHLHTEFGAEPLIKVKLLRLELHGHVFDVLFRQLDASRALSFANREEVDFREYGRQLAFKSLLRGYVVGELVRQIEVFLELRKGRAEALAAVEKPDWRPNIVRAVSNRRARHYDTTYKACSELVKGLGDLRVGILDLVSLVEDHC